jgi:hypothetical protein
MGCVFLEESWSIETVGIFGRGIWPGSDNNERYTPIAFDDCEGLRGMLCLEFDWT